MLLYVAVDEPIIVIRALVVRVVTPALRVSGLRGMAVEIEEITCLDGVDALYDFLRRFLNCPEQEVDEDQLRIDDSGGVTFKLMRIPIAAGAGAASRYLQEELLKPNRTVPDERHSNEEQLRGGLFDVNRRSSKRASVFVDVTYYVGGMPHLGTVLNISRRGLYLKTGHVIPPLDTQLVVRVPVAEAPDPQYVRIEGIIRRTWNPKSESLPGFALRFVVVDELGRQGIFRTYLERFDKKKKSSGIRVRGFHYAKVRRIK
jgi:hypothetical protein